MEWFVPAISSIVGALIGGFLAGYFALKATKKAHQNNLLIQKKNEENVLKGVLQALHDEIETLIERYQETVGSHIESLEAGKPFLFYYPIFSDFFTVYNSNAFLIGKINDNDLRKLLVRTYVLAKGLVDSYQMNNEFIQKYAYWNALFIETNNEAHKLQSLAYYDALVSYAVTLKQLHNEVKKNANDLLRALRKQGVLSEIKT